MFSIAQSPISTIHEPPSHSLRLKGRRLLSLSVGAQYLPALGSPLKLERFDQWPPSPVLIAPPPRSTEANRMGHLAAETNGKSGRASLAAALPQWRLGPRPRYPGAEVATLCLPPRSCRPRPSSGVHTSRTPPTSEPAPQLPQRPGAHSPAARR